MARARERNDDDGPATIDDLFLNEGLTLESLQTALDRFPDTSCSKLLAALDLQPRDFCKMMTVADCYVKVLGGRELRDSEEQLQLCHIKNILVSTAMFKARNNQRYKISVYTRVGFPTNSDGNVALASQSQRVMYHDRDGCSHWCLLESIHEGTVDADMSNSKSLSRAQQYSHNRNEFKAWGYDDHFYFGLVKPNGVTIRMNSHWNPSSAIVPGQVQWETVDECVRVVETTAEAFQPLLEALEDLTCQAAELPQMQLPAFVHNLRECLAHYRPKGMVLFRFDSFVN